MPRPQLEPKIFEYLKEKLKGQVGEKSIKPALSRIRSKNLGLTLNACAEVYARKKGLSVSRYLNKEDRDSLRNVQFVKINVPPKKIAQKRKIKEIVKYETDNKWLKGLLREINKSYSNGCYTACFVLCRKVLENLIIHNIIKEKYPSKRENHKEIYFDFDRGRYFDFSIILSNLRKKSNEFGTEKILVERICQLSDGFKETANEMTHSLYHIARKIELDEKNIQEILDMISELEAKL